MMIPSSSPLGAQHRVGFGYDIHRLARGRALILGGVRIPFDRGLSGHSDADVVCHAVADALFGAAALGDIGMHFPNDDPVWKGADSLFLLTLVIERVRKAGYLPVNVDATLIAEKPQISSYVRTMRSRIGKALRLPVSAVSVKATTNEGLGALGRSQGMACMAVALVRRK